MFVTSNGEDHESVSWYLEEFVFGKDLTVKDNTTIFVDRATHEFGNVFYLSDSEVAFVSQFPDTEEPVFFSAKDALAACWHSKSRKVTILLLQQTQVDLKFTTSLEARKFLDAFEDAAATAHNISFTTYEHHSPSKFKEKSFDMVKEQIAGRVVQPWMNAHHKPVSEWPSLRKSGEWSDFTILAGEKSFAVHRIKLCKESEYFRAMCNDNFAESNSRSVKLPESAQTIDVLLDEIYGVYNSTTGSLFTGFALRSEMEKERLLNDLLDLFIAADKYALEEVKTKVARAIVDRMQFVEDPLTLVDLGVSIFDEQCPQVDRGLRKAITGLLCMDRMPAIMDNQAAWEEYTGNKALLRAVHLRKFPGARNAESYVVIGTEQCATPPETPTGVKRKRASRNV